MTEDLREAFKRAFETFDLDRLEPLLAERQRLDIERLNEVFEYRARLAAFKGNHDEAQGWRAMKIGEESP